MDPLNGVQDPHVYISGGNDDMSCKLFLGTLRGYPMLEPYTFQGLTTHFVLQFVTNKAKKAFQKGLRARQFSDSLVLRMPLEAEHEGQRDLVEAILKGMLGDWFTHWKRTIGQAKNPLFTPPLKTKRAQILR
ncbi:hypothetical protein CR513_61820, partial [Mucuna pruriens]